MEITTNPLYTAIEVSVYIGEFDDGVYPVKVDIDLLDSMARDFARKAINAEDEHEARYWMARSDNMADRAAMAREYC